jgi:putative hemolysin
VDVPIAFPAFELAGIVFCLVLSALFSGTETTLTALSESKIRHISERSPWAKRWLHYTSTHAGRVLTSLLIGNNLVNVAASVLGAQLATYYVPEQYQEIAAVFGMTFMLLAVGEVTPKTIARLNPERYAELAALYGVVADSLFRPLSWVMQRALQGVLDRSGINPDHYDKPSITRDELEYMIELAQTEKVLDEPHSRILASVMEFRDTQVKEVMVPRPRLCSLPTNADLDTVLATLAQSGHSRIPVYEGSEDNIVGLLYTKDLIALLHRRNESARPMTSTSLLSGILRRQVNFVPETMKILALLRDMQKRRSHMAIVVDEFGAVAGIITLEDILEELVGDIHDEYDRSESPIKELGGGEYIVQAGVSIFDLGQALNTEFPDTGDYGSLGGFLTSTHGGVPPIGTVIQWGEYDFRVIESDKRRVIRVKVQRHGAEASKSTPLREPPVVTEREGTA